MGKSDSPFPGGKGEDLPEDPQITAKHIGEFTLVSS
jgi:hypothetical protein